MHKNERPLIAIPTGEDRRRLHQHELYLRSVEGAGGEAIFIGPDVSIIDTLTRFTGFLIPGGRDIDPVLYGEKIIYDVDPEDGERVNFDLALFSAALKQGKPVLGICYGMQLINVAMGGTLFQDISAQKRGGINHREGNHPVLVKDNPFVGTGEYEVNSSHHQAVRDTGRGIKALALSPDSVIEAFYAPGHRFLMGVQWHPERLKNTLSDVVFHSFIEACREQI